MKKIIFTCLVLFSYGVFANVNGDSYSSRIMEEARTGNKVAGLSKEDHDTIADARSAAEYGNKIIAETLSGVRDPSLSEEHHQSIEDAREAIAASHGERSEGE